MNLFNRVAQKLKSRMTQYRVVIFALGTSVAVVACGNTTTPGGGGGNVPAGPDTTKAGSWTEFDPIPSKTAGNGFSFAVAADGKKIVGGIRADHIYTSDDSGKSWVDRSPATGDASGPIGWTSFASSNDGVKLVAVAYGHSIFASADSGKTWQIRSPAAGDASGALNWAAIASSSDGKMLAAAVSDGELYTSDDSGGKWTKRSPTSGDASGMLSWSAIVSSSDGKYITAITSSQTAQSGTPSHIYTSDNSGLSWKDRTLTNANIASVANWRSIATSADGKYRVATAEGKNNTDNYVKVFTSDNFGETWTEHTPTKLVDAAAKKAINTDTAFTAYVTSSSDGSRIAVVATGGSGGYMFTSSNYGAAWTEQTLPAVPKGVPLALFSGIASSADGKIINLLRSEFSTATLSGPPNKYRMYTLTFP